MLFAYLAVFCGVILLLIWSSQSLLLNRIYSRIMLSRMDAAAGDLATICDSERAQRGAEVIAVNYQVGIAVFDLTDTGLGSRLLWAGGEGGSVLSRLTNAEYAELYAAASVSGSVTRTYSDRFDFAPSEVGGTLRPPLSITADAHRIVRVRLMETPSGNQIVVFLDAAMMPVGSAAGALQVEILLLSIVLVVGALCLAYVMSRRVVAPITRLTEKAGRLAGGHYDVSFAEESSYREIGELSATLDYAAGELSKVDGLQKELIANISHDLRTPLTMIIGYGEIMRDIEGENKPENVQVIIDEAKRLSGLVNDILQLSRYQAGCETLDISSFNLAEELQHTAASYGQMLEGRGFHFFVQVPGALPVTADRLRVQQVINNLVSNAVNYAGDSREIMLIGKQLADGYLRVEVVDHGEGIPPDKLADIWQRYYKVDAQHKRSVIGSGLGLSIVRGILELHHARYGVESRLGEGSRFWFELPPKQ